MLASSSSLLSSSSPFGLLPSGRFLSSASSPSHFQSHLLHFYTPAYLSSLTLTNTSSVCILSLQLLFSNPLHNHASNAFNLLISSRKNCLTSIPYNLPHQYFYHSLS